MIDWILPVSGALIAFLTPKGCYKNINTILACLLIFIFGYEQHIVENNLYDSAWHDVALFAIYGLCAALFCRAGGNRQFKLSLLGMSLCFVYGGFGFYYEYFDARNWWWTEAFITLSILQLIVASDGVAWTALYKKIGGRNDIRDSADGSGSHSVHRRHR